VNKEMQWRCFSLILLLTLPGPKLSSKAAPGGSLPFTISVYNDAGVPEETLRQGEKEASRIFRRAGIEVNWLNCGIPMGPEASAVCREAVFPKHLHLRIVRKARSLKKETLGISFVSADGRGCYADLFYERIEDLNGSGHANLASLLGHVAAHEVGHLLLGTNSHAPTGIMRARWTLENLQSPGSASSCSPARKGNG
jgi:hypothetical protein